MTTLADSKVTQRDLARVLGCSEALVSRLYRDGTFRRGAPLAALVQAYVERAVRLAESAPNTSEELERERVGLYKARRELAELDLRERRGELVKVADMSRSMVSYATVVRAHFWNWQGKLPPLLAYREPREIAVELEKQTREALESAIAHLDAESVRVYRWLEANPPAELLPEPEEGS